MLHAMQRLAIAVVLAAGAAADRVAIAEPQPSGEAAVAFQQGRELAKQGRYGEACTLFARSYELDPGLGTAVNLADCLERQGELRRAWELFDVVARNSHNVQSRARLARERADALVGKLATVVVRMRDPTTAGLAIRLGERELAPAAEIRELIEPRDVELVATAPGRSAYRITLHAVAGATIAADIPALDALGALGALGVGAGALAAPPGESPPTRRRRSRVYLAGGLGAAALAGLGTSLGFAIAARRTYNSAFDHGCRRMSGDVVCDPADTGRALIDKAGRRADLATGFVIGGAAIAVAAAAVFVTAPREVIQVAPIASGQQLGLSIVGRF
jgi:tetratricopeptide (TPR) repeat protein